MKKLQIENNRHRRSIYFNQLDLNKMYFVLEIFNFPTSVPFGQSFHCSDKYLGTWKTL